MRKITNKQPIWNRNFLIKHCFLLFLLSWTVSSSAKDTGSKNEPPFSKEFQVHGKVTDQKGVGLSGATITEKGTTNSTSSTSDGNCTINVHGQTATLLISYVGFTPREVSVSGSTTDLVVELISEDASL